MRLLGLQTIKPPEISEETKQKLNENLNKTKDEMSGLVSAANKGTTQMIDSINDFVGNKIIDDSLKESAAKFGETSANLLSDFNKAVNTPEFKEETKVALDNAAVVASIAIKAADKPINDAIDVTNEAGSKVISAVASGAVKAGVDMAAAVPGVGSIINIIKISNDVTAAAKDVVEATTTATEAVNKAIKETSENINEGLNKLEEQKNRVDKIAKPFTPYINDYVKKKTGITQTGGDLKKLKNEKNQVAGRINNSIDEFSNPILFLSGGKTKKHLFKSNKGKSKRVRFSL